MFTIQFDFGIDGMSYAGMYKGALGFAPTLATAKLWPSEEIAQRFLDNGYGKNTNVLGRVIEVPDADL